MHFKGTFGDITHIIKISPDCRGTMVKVISSGGQFSSDNTVSAITADYQAAFRTSFFMLTKTASSFLLLHL
jgi:hypothetical protein